MARFLLVNPVVGQPGPQWQSQGVFPRGTAIADSLANAQGFTPDGGLAPGYGWGPGYTWPDVIWPQLTNAASPYTLVPLDADGSVAMQGAPIWTLAQLASSPWKGGDKVPSPPNA